MLTVKVFADDMERLEHHVYKENNSKVFKYYSKGNGAILDVSSVVKHNNKDGNFAIMDLVIDTSQFSIGFLENTRNWPPFVKKVERMTSNFNL